MIIRKSIAWFVFFIGLAIAAFVTYLVVRFLGKGMPYLENQETPLVAVVISVFACIAILLISWLTANRIGRIGDDVSKWWNKSEKPKTLQ